MNKLLFFVILLGVCAIPMAAQDTIYVMHGGRITYQVPLADLDSMGFVNHANDRSSILNELYAEPSLNLFKEALVLTGLSDSLRGDMDKRYEALPYESMVTVHKSDNQWFYQWVPQSRLYGYTLFAETDAVYAKNGITSLNDLKQYAATLMDPLFPEDVVVKDPTNRKNSLNRFIAYHIVLKKLNIDQLIDVYDNASMIKSTDLCEYLEPMAPNTLLEISKIRATGKTNQINRSTSTGEAVQVVRSIAGGAISNGVIHEIDRLLIYSSEIRNTLANKRLRFDVSSLLPELTNAGLRRGNFSDPNLQCVIPNGFLSNLNESPGLKVTYYTPSAKFSDFEGDEVSFSCIKYLSFQFTLPLPPVPTGTYEIRLGYHSTSQSGIVNLSVDNQPIGLPIDFSITGLEAEIGYVTPGNDPSDPIGYENDKALRNHGYLKGPASFKATVNYFYNSANGRMEPTSLRKIIGTYTFNKEQKHSLTFDVLFSQGALSLDYIEFVPVDLLENEDMF